MSVKGFKVFNSDWTCRNKQYSCPGRFEEDGELSICDHGMHFCKRIEIVFFIRNLIQRLEWQIRLFMMM